jgi:3-oxoacyl-[acyl-carrier protein] reductase
VPGPAIVASRCPDLGAACVRRLAADGRTVGLLADGFDPLPGTGPSADASGGVAAGLDRLVAEVGTPEAVVGVLGPGRSQSVLRGSDDVFDEHLAASIGFLYRVAGWGAKALVPARAGRIVLVASVVGLYGGSWETAHGAASAGALGLARSLARELGPAGITVNVVVAGAVRTAHLDEVGATKAGGRHLREMEERSALGRLGHPDEVAEAVAWLASADASYVTGAIVPVDGGLAGGFA